MLCKYRCMKTRVLFLYDFPLWGNGSATFLRNISESLIDHGYSIGVVAPETRNSNDHIKLFSVDLPEIPVFVSHPELSGAREYAELSADDIFQQMCAYTKTTLDAINSFKPHIIHVNHVSIIAWVARYVSSVTGIPYITTCHGSDLHFIAEDKRYFDLSKDAMRGSSRITVVSRDTRHWFSELFGDVFTRKIKIVPGGVNMSEFPEDLDVSSVEKEYGLEGEKVVLFAGRLTEQKGVKYLIKAAQKIKGKVLIVGDGIEKRFLVNYAKKMKVKNVHFLGYLGKENKEKLRQLYYRADVLVVPSVWDEPLGLVILEAMAAQTPVIATKKGGIPSIIKDGVNGMFVAERSSGEIGLRVNELLEDDAKRKNMGKRARKVVMDKFQWENVALSLEKIYEKHAIPWTNIK